jgi:ribosome-binding protein aMBF1 (putative translation factor)
MDEELDKRISTPYDSIMNDASDASDNVEARVRTAATDLMAVLREEMRRTRKQRGWTQEEAARHAGMNQPLWSRIEHGGQEPGLQALLGIQLAVGVVSVEKLFGQDAPTRTGKALGMDDPGA